MSTLILGLMLLAVTAFWGWSFVLIRWVVGDPSHGCPVMPFLALRFLIAAALLLPFAVRDTSRRLWCIGSGLGLVLAIGYFLQTEGLRYTTPTNSALITGLFVVFVPAWDWVLFRIRLRPRLLLAVAMSLAGVFLLVGYTPACVRFGDLLTLGCAACYGLHVSLLSHAAKAEPPLPLTLIQMLTVGLLCSAAWPAMAPVAWPAARFWPAILVMAVVGSALAFYVQTLVQGRLSAISTALILCAEPLFGALSGYLFAGDRLRALQGVGALLIVCAIFFDEICATMQTRKARTPEACAPTEP